MSPWSRRCNRRFTNGRRAMLPYRLVYHDRYDLNLGDHVFPSRKFRWLHDRLLHTRFAVPEDFEAPEPATDDDVRLVHDADYVARLRTGTLYQEILRLEILFAPDGGSFLAGGRRLILAARPRSR